MQPKDHLRAIADRQAGFFTAAQATEAGYPDSLHVYHTREGHWEKVQRGIYRLADAPRADWPELVVWSLWSRDRNGFPQIVYSHETAEMIHGLRPRAPGPLHATVPRAFRKNCAMPPDLILYKDDLPPEAIEERAGYRVRALPASPRIDYNRVIEAGED
ncbi:MAG TPA: type IV toxin-antitoxin system AbiEi family antitoxin domain-containing protein [Kiritimatiellia bacterium]|nr:type IV toxin-antitoxin system AbiEi family antitoxin domain-containing protein [Kiritimatiellia bacterium]